MVCQNFPKEKSWDKPRQERHDEPREEQHEVLGGYTDYVSVQECKSVNVPVCSPVHHKSYHDVTGQISILVPRQKRYGKSRKICHQVPKEVYNSVSRM